MAIYKKMKCLEFAIIHTLLLVLLACPSLGAGQPIKVEHLIFSYIEGAITQHEAFKVLKEAYRRLGISVDAEILPAERAVKIASAGVTSGEVARLEGLENTYPDLVRVPEPLITMRVMAVTTGKSFPVDGWDSLRPHILCYTHGVKIFEQGTDGMLRMPATDGEHTIKLLRQGHCDVALLDSRSWLIIDRISVGPLRELEPPVTIIPLYHYLHRRHIELVPLVADELRKMREEGVIQAILKPGEDAVLAAKARQSIH